MANYVGRRGYVGNAIYFATIDLVVFISLIVIKHSEHLQAPLSVYVLFVAIGSLLGFIASTIDCVLLAYFGNRYRNSRIRNSMNKGYSSNYELYSKMRIVFWVLIGISIVIQLVFGLITLISIV